MSHLPPAHYETSKRDSPSEPKVKEKQNETIPDLNSNLAKSMTHHNQTKELTTWFLILCIIASEFRLIGTNVLEPYDTSRLHGLGNLYLM
jgi:hypothetical protein